MKNKLSTIYDLRFAGVKPICSKRCCLIVLVIFLIALIVTGSLFWFIHFKGLHTRRVYLDLLNNFMKNTEICTGDLIFRRGSSFESLMVLSLDRGSQYSHVGVVLVEDDTVWVVHTEPGKRDSDDEVVRKEPLALFLAPDRATQYALYRLFDTILLSKTTLTHWLDSIYDSSIPFDYGFDDTDSMRLYCSELVWKGYQRAGISLLLEKNSSIVLFGMKLSVILPSSLLDRHPFQKVAAYP
jgi:hypothetical protein